MNWEKVNLEDVIEKPISGEWGDEGNSVYVLRTTNFSNDGSLDLKDLVTRNISTDKVERKKLLMGDTILEKSGGSPNQPVGRVVYFNIAQDNGTKYLCNNFTSIIRPKENVHPKYLFWFLFNNHSSKKTLSYQNKTTGIINLQTERYIKEQKIPLPSLSIQQKIAAILDKADMLRKKDQLLLDKYDELLQSIFYDMFGDPVKNEKGWGKGKLQDFCQQITDGTHFSPPSALKGIPYITAKHVKKEGLDFFSAPTFVSPEHHAEIYKRCSPVKGDVLYIKDGATTGIAAINNYDFQFSMLSSLALIKPNKQRLNNFYLIEWLNNYSVKDLYIRTYMAGAAIKRFTLQKINTFEILIPPIELQKKFSTIVENINQQKQSVKKQLEKSENLFQSLLQKAFNGHLVQ